MRNIITPFFLAAAIWAATTNQAFAQEPPITVITSTAKAEPGFIFTTPGPPSWLVITGNFGPPIFSSEHVQPLYDFKRQGDVLTFFNSETGRFEVLNQDYQLIDTWQASGYETDVHDLQLLDNGGALLLVYREFEYDMSLVVPGGSPTATVVSCVIQEIAADKSLAWQWDSWDYLPITQTNRNLLAGRIDYAHCNAVEQDGDGNVLLSSRSLDEITKINRQTGAVMWRLGGQGNEFIFTNDAGFTLQHDIRRIDNGHITLFDNGTAARGYSRAVEYEIDEAAKVITRAWEFRGPFAPCCGNAQRLPLGNTLINFGHGHPTIIEVTPEGEIALAIDMPFSYRSFKFPWVVKYYLPIVGR